MAFNCLTATDPLRGDRVLFTAKSTGFLGTHLIDLERIKSCVNLAPPSGFETGIPGLGIDRPNQ